MKKDLDSARSRSRPRKKAAVAVATPAESPVVQSPETGSTSSGNVGPLESSFSLLLGGLLILAALFPRSIKQLLLLGMGGGLVYRGMTSHCGLYQAMGLDSAKGSLIRQINEKYLATGPH